MLVNRRVAQYLNAVASNLDAVEPKYRTNYCPECDQRISWSETYDHLVLDVQGPEQSIVVVIGCEGGPVVPPSQVGLGWLFPAWEPWGGVPVIR